MAVSAPVPANPLPAAAQRIAAFMAGFSLEATRPTDADIAALGILAHGTRIYISALPGRPAEESIAAAKRLAGAGFEPVPHVAVRNFASGEALDDFLARLTGEAAVHRLLVIAGDRGEYGPYRCALDAIDSGVFRRRGIRAIGIAGYPDGHPRIGRAAPTSLASLLRYAARCGVRASAQALATRAGLVRRMFAMSVPDDLIRALAEAGLANVSTHFFSFGGLPASARWARAVADGNIVIQGETGFAVAPPSQDS